ncbi:MAG TPA: pyridoxal-phosphate dependent enzyme [Rhodanobacteraceae bacterium]|nr:pyridoxal-phosphate dependent enzyme [Rhodanobacteraceae bacterium]
MSRLPDFAAIEAARARIAPHAVCTPILRSDALDHALGAQVVFKCENRQHSGAFKYRGALNAVWSLSEDEAQRGVVTHSSGNHGAALALAARSRGITAHVVVPEGAVAAKVANIERAGGTVHYCAPTMAAREAAAAALAASRGATLIHPYTDPRVIAGQGTAALELLEQAGMLDVLLIPLGGGGLASGTAIAAHGVDAAIRVVGAEPDGAADTIASLAAGRRITDIVADTICDGLRGTVGEINLACLIAHEVTVLPVSDAEVTHAMAALREHLGETVEPSSATVLAALARHREHFAGARVGVILSGGNVEGVA